MEDTQVKPIKKKLRIVIAVAIPLVFFLYLFGILMNYSLNDPDVWWHLRTGQYILEHWEVPDEDPFAYTTPRPLSEANKTGLRAQWLGQVIFYLSYSIGGYPGIIVFRNILIILPMLILYIWLLRKGISPWASIITVSLSASMLAIHLFYSLERPQGISFNCALLVVMLLERLKHHTRHGHMKENPRLWDSSYLLLPLVMLFWSNVHGGYIIGIVIIMTYMGVEALRVIYDKLIQKAGITTFSKAFFAVTAGSIIASFGNPNTYKVSYSYIVAMGPKFMRDIVTTTLGRGGGGGWVENVILEFKPLMYFYENLGYEWLLFYWVFTGFLGVVILWKCWQKRTIDIAEIAVVVMIAAFANMYARGLMFSLTILPFYLAKNIAEIKMPPIKYKAVFRGIIAILLVLTIAFYAHTNYSDRAPLKPGITTLWISPWYPSRLVEFLRATKIPAPMYNFYTWGGFLIWAAYPQYQVFIDGRALDDSVNQTADSMLKAFPGWQEHFKAYNINFIVIPVIFRESGHAIPLATALVDDKDWKLVFILNNSAVFVRDVPQNQNVIRAYNFDKRHVYSEIIASENILLPAAPDNPVFNITKADALLALDRYAEAKAIYERFPMEGSEGMRKLKEKGY